MIGKNFVLTKVILLVSFVINIWIPSASSFSRAGDFQFNTVNSSTTLCDFFSHLSFFCFFLYTIFPLQGGAYLFLLIQGDSLLENKLAIARHRINGNAKKIFFNVVSWIKLHQVFWYGKSIYIFIQKKILIIVFFTLTSMIFILAYNQ